MAQPAQAPRPSPLSLVTRGKLAKPFKVFVYGQAGIGKSTFAAGAPMPIFLPTEDGTNELDVARFPRPETWADALACIDALTHEEHPHKTLAIDTLGGLEALCWKSVCAAGNKGSIEDFGYGKGYVAAIDQWRVLVSKLEQAQAKRGMHVVLIAHAVAKNQTTPGLETYARWRPGLDAKATDLLAGWVDAMMFATREVMTVKRSNNVHGISDGDRLLRTEWNAAYDAKNRFNLEDPLPLGWAEFQAGARDVARIRERCNQLLEQLPADKHAAASKALADAGDDPGKLAGLLNRLTLTVTPATTETKDETSK